MDKNLKQFWQIPPWQFQNRTGKMAPEHKRLNRYVTMKPPDITALPVSAIAEDTAHLYLWVPNALLPEGLAVMKAWGFEYKSNIVWEKIRKDGQPDGRSQVNLWRTQKREHSRKPDEIFDIIQNCSLGPYLELFARGHRPGWSLWGNQAGENYAPSWATYKNADKSVELPTR